MIVNLIGIFELSKFFFVGCFVFFFFCFTILLLILYIFRLYEEAVETAFEQRDINTLNVLQQKSNMMGNRQLLERVNTCIAITKK